jgi:hypothetical protein
MGIKSVKPNSAGSVVFLRQGLENPCGKSIMVELSE